MTQAYPLQWPAGWKRTEQTVNARFKTNNSQLTVADAPQTEVKNAYRKLAAEHHPDKGGDSEKMVEINWAYHQAGFL